MRTRERRARRGARKAEIGFFEEARSSLAVERRGKTRRVSGARAEGRRRASRRARGARVRRRGAHLDVRHGYAAVLELLDAEERLRELLVLSRSRRARRGATCVSMMGEETSGGEESEERWQRADDGRARAWSDRRGRVPRKEKHVLKSRGVFADADAQLCACAARAPTTRGGITIRSHHLST